MARWALVVGGSGQIGSHVVDALVDRGYRVVVLDPRPPLTEWAGLIERDVVVYRHGSSLDVRQVNAIAEEYPEIREIYDFGAWLGSEELTSLLDTAVHYNLLGARNVAELARRLDARLYHITIEFADYVGAGSAFTDGYSVTKFAALKVVQEYAKKYGVHAVAGLTHHVFCERQRLLPARKIMPTLIAYAVTGAPFRIFGDPEKRMDLLYARDYAEIVVDLLNSDEAKLAHEHVYDIGCGRALTLRELVERTYRAAGREPRYVVMDDWRMQASDPYRVASNDWVEVLGERRLRCIEDMLEWLVAEYRRRYTMDDFRLAVAVYEQRHRFKWRGV